MSSDVTDQTEPPVDETVDFHMRAFFREYVAVHLKSHTAKSYQCFWRNHISPRLGSKILREVTVEDVEEVHLELRDKPTTANRIVSLLSKFFSWCVNRGILDKDLSLSRKLIRYHENKIQRFLSQKQMRSIWETIGRLEEAGRLNKVPAAALKLIVLTGARKNEILTLKWDDLELDGHRIVLTDSKTGFKVIYLSQQAEEILRGVERTGDFVFPSKSASGHLFDLQWQWRQILREAALAGKWRIHDLRHGFASTAVNNGGSLSYIGFLLGHKRVSTTERYAHVAENPAQDLLDKVCRIITSGK
ncbi:MAG: site-specific integrase [Deltaproteobacteria bacterium]|jgi:integrase|nr:site-specific integrase [Deltaproteobacteria bacterium]